MGSVEHSWAELVCTELVWTDYLSRRSRGKSNGNEDNIDHRSYTDKLSSREI